MFYHTFTKQSEKDTSLKFKVWGLSTGKELRNLTDFELDMVT